MKIGIIGAMDVEVDIIKNVLNNYQQIIYGGSLYYTGDINQTSCVVVKCGIGKVNSAICATTLINIFDVDLIINTGIAGGVAPLQRGDLVLANKLSYSDVDVSIFGYDIGQIPGAPKYFNVSEAHLLKVKSIFNKENILFKTGNVLSGDKFCNSLDLIKETLTKDITAVEMEGASIAHVCNNYCVPFVSIRYISDVIGEENQEEEYLKFETETANKSAHICLKIISNFYD